METRIGFGRRFGAFVIDIVFISGIGFILTSLFNPFFENFVDWSKITDEVMAQAEMVYGSFTNIMFTISVGITLASFAYNILEGFTGFTLGKLMLGIQVGKQDGTPAPTNILMLRFAIKNISTIVGLVAMATLVSAISYIGTGLGIVIFIGCFFVLGDKKMALHDIIAKTAVYRKADLADGTAAKPDFMG